jgi:hypothetical protein
MAGLEGIGHLQSSTSASRNDAALPRLLSAIPEEKGDTSPETPELIVVKSAEKSEEKKVEEKGKEETCYVAKMSIDPYEEREAYFQDVTMQMYAKAYAEKYNTYKPPKTIAFIKAFILELSSRPLSPLCAVERFISGPYRKHNNNFGYVGEDERNTPQAFSHFTYEASQHQILICDIQGVGDLYTDPQIHSLDGLGFGKGNMGERGFDKFLSTHRCNAICRYLKLPSINSKQDDDAGTLPATRYMSYTKVEVYNLDLTSASVSFADTYKLRASTINSPTRPLLGPPNGRESSSGCCCTIS